MGARRGPQLSSEDKAAGLGDLIHLTTRKPADALMFRKEPTADGRAAYRVIESKPLEIPAVASSVSSATATRLAKADPAVFADAAIRALKGNQRGKVGAQDVTGAAGCASTPAATAPQSGGDSGATPSPDQPFPPDLIYYVVYYCDLSAQKIVLPTSVTNKTFNQVASAVFNTTFTVALNNKVHPLGDFQFVMVQNDTSSTPAIGGFANQNKEEYAWFQDQITHDVTPENKGALTWVSDGPNAANADNVYTASSGFSVGFSGLSGEGAYSWENSTEYSVPDWKVSSIFDAGAGHAGWNFRSGTPDADAAHNGDAWLNSFYGTVLPPNLLSLSQNVLHTSVTYKTPALDSGREAFNVSQSVRLYDIACTPLTDDKFCGDPLHGKAPTQITQHLVFPASDLFTVDLSAVIPDPVKDISFAQNPVTPGATVIGTVTLARPAPIDTPVSLSTSTVNSNASIVTSPVIVKQGETSAAFTVLTNGNGIGSQPGDQVVVPITAFNAGAFTKQLSLRFPRITSLTFDPGVVTASSKTTLTVTTDVPVLADTVVPLASDKSFAVPAASAVTIARGASSATVAVQTSENGLPPGTTAAATFTARLPGQTFAAPLTVTNPVIRGITFSPNPVAGGATVTGTVTLTAPAAVDTVLPLSLGGANAKLTAPGVKIARGQTGGTFQLQTNVNGLGAGASTAATVTSSYGGQSATSPQLTVVNPKIKSLTHAPDSVTAGQPVTVTVTMDQPVGADTEISLKLLSTNATVPASVTVPAGRASASFTAGTNATFLTPGSSSLQTVQATYAGQQALTTDFTVSLPSTSFKSFTLDKNPVVAGQRARGTITLTDPAPVDIGIQVSSNSPNVFVDPLSPPVIVPKGGTVAFVNLVTYDTNLKVGDSVNATLTATSAAFPNQQIQARLTVGLPQTATIQSITFSPNPLTAGQTTTATVTLSAPAPETIQPLVVYGSANINVYPHPKTPLQFTRGQTTASFQIATSADRVPSGSYPVTVTVTYPYSQTFDAKFTVTAP